MRSKWLDWTPGFVGFVGAGSGENPIIHTDDPRIMGNLHGDEATKPTKPPLIGKEDSSDPYRDRARAMLAKVTDQPVGLIPWLRQNHPALYEQLVNSIPDDIHRLWEDQAPLPEFQSILDLWLAAHETACEMYRRGEASGPNSPQGSQQGNLGFPKDGCAP